MKLLDIAKTIEKSPSNEAYVETSEIGYELGINGVPDVDQERLKCYWVGHWYCTDTYVGYRMYFLDDEAVAFSIQRGRKLDEEFDWFSLDLAAKTRDYLLSLIIKEDEELNVSIVDINDEVGEGFQIVYNSQIIRTDNVTLNGEKVEIIERVKNKPYGIDDELRVKLPDGKEKNIDIIELNFGFNLNV